MRHRLQAEKPFKNTDGLPLLAMRAGWLVITLYAVLLVAASLPHYWALRIPQDLAEATITSAMFRQDFSQAAFEVPLSVKLLTLIPFFFFVGCGIFIFYQRSRDWVAFVVSLLLITMGATFTVSLSYLPVTTAAWQAPAGILEAILYSCSFLFLLVFPDGRFVPRWSRWLALGWLGYTALWPVWPILNPQQSPSVLPILLQITMFLFGISAQVYRTVYRADATQRQQLKWVLYGYATAVGGMLWVFGPQLVLTDSARHYFLSPPLVWINLTIALIFPLLIPVTLMLSVLRYRLWDIDLIINRTLVYGGLTLLITAAYILLVGGLGALAANQSGQVIGLVLATGIVAAGLRPLHRSLQATADRFVTVPDSPSNREFKDEKANKMTATPPQPRSRWLIVGAVVLALAALLSLASLVLAGCGSFSYLGVTGISISFASGMAFSTLGILIFAYQPHNRIGWLCLWIGIGLPSVSAIDIYANCGIAGQITAPGLAYLAWFSYSFGVFFPLVPMFILLPMLYHRKVFVAALAMGNGGRSHYRSYQRRSHRPTPRF
jgi:hypothetical protein